MSGVLSVSVAVYWGLPLASVRTA